jgi:hypothetical protein
MAGATFADVQDQNLSASIDQLADWLRRNPGASVSVTDAIGPLDPGDIIRELAARGVTLVRVSD